MKYDVAVAWRIYPGVSKQPIIFSDNKLKLVEACLKSFIAATEGLSIRYFFILDGCPKEYIKLINGLFPGNSTSIFETSAIGNGATFRKQVEILMEQSDSDLVYFAEDDYLYLPGQFVNMINLLRTKKEVDFVSAYLHADTFTHPIHSHRRNIIFAANHVWISDSSTCLTFLTSKKNLIETKDLFLTYSKGNNDCAIWLVLTKKFIFNPFSYMFFYLKHKECYDILKMAVKYSFRYFFNLRRYHLWIPIPSMGTHLEAGLVSPDNDWEKVSMRLK